MNEGKCLQCNTSIARNKKYCSTQCCGEYKHSQCLKEILQNKGFKSTNAVHQSTTLRKFLFEILENVCSICNNSTWNNQPIPLIVDHIDGDCQNNLLDNLRLVCPNCDAQLPTFKGKNRGKGRHSLRMKRYHEGKSW